jgi:hypothetical protein
MGAPAGVALFLRSWRFASGANDPASAVRVYQAAGLRWGMPVVARVRDDGSFIAKLREAAYWRAFARAGVPLWGCLLLPKPNDRCLSESLRLVDALAELGAAGLVNDPELEMKGQASFAGRYNDALRRRCADRGIGYAVTSYSITTAHPSFPWEAFADCDFGIAQTYDRDNRFEADYVERALSSWRAKGFSDVIPCRGLNDHQRSRTKSVAALRRHFALLPSPRSAGVWGPVTVPRAQWAELASWARTSANGGGRGGRGRGASVALGLGLAGLVALGGLLANGQG